MDPKKKDLISLAIIIIICTTCCLWFNISSNCSSFEYTPPKAVKRYMELVLNPYLVEDQELLRISISDDAHKTLDDFPDFSNTPIKISQYDESFTSYDINVFLADGRSFPVKLDYAEWAGRCPTIRRIPDRKILTHIQLAEVGYHYLPPKPVRRFMELLYTAIEEGDDKLLKKLASDEAIMLLESSYPSYENVEEIFMQPRIDGAYMIMIKDGEDFVDVWIEYKAFPKGFDYSKMTDEQILESLYLIRASKK